MEIIKAGNNFIDIKNGKFIFDDKDVLIISDNDNITWFKGIDIANILEYKRANKAILDNITDKNKINFADLKVTGSVPFKIHPQTIFINESGLYKLIFRSKMPKAEMFTDWVTNEVLPSIRKNGEYKIKREFKEIVTYKNNEISKLQNSLDFIINQNNDLLIENKKFNNQIVEFREKYDSDTKELNNKLNIFKKNNKKLTKKLDKLEEDLNKKSETIEKKQNRIIELVTQLKDKIIKSNDPNKEPMILILYFEESQTFKIVRGQKKRVGSIKKKYRDDSIVFYMAYEPNPITFFDKLRFDLIEDEKLIFSGLNDFKLAEDYSQEDFLEDLDIMGLERIN